MLFLKKLPVVEEKIDIFIFLHIGSKFPVSMAGTTDYAEDAFACSCGEIYDLNVYDDDEVPKMLNCKSDRHGCICNAKRVINWTEKCRALDHVCMCCEDAVIEGLVECKASKHRCTCREDEVIEGLVECKASTHLCTCKVRKSDIPILSLSNTCKSTKHPCICRKAKANAYANVHLCISTSKCVCTCDICPYECKAGLAYTHSCVCNQKDIDACRCCHHLCSCGKNPDSCLHRPGKERPNYYTDERHECRCMIHPRLCEKGTVNRQNKHFCSCDNTDSGPGECLYDPKFGSDDHLCACLRKGPENCIRRKNHYLECSVHRNQWTCLQKTCENLGVRRGDYQPWMTKSERKR
jgi:hypothetical protein